MLSPPYSPDQSVAPSFTPSLPGLDNLVDHQKDPLTMMALFPPCLPQPLIQTPDLLSPILFPPGPWFLDTVVASHTPVLIVPPQFPSITPELGPSVT